MADTDGWAHRMPSSDERRTVAGQTLTPAQLMERLQVSENVIYWELKHGCLKHIAFKCGHQWRVGEAALERLMAGGE